MECHRLSSRGVKLEASGNALPGFVDPSDRQLHGGAHIEISCIAIHFGHIIETRQRPAHVPLGIAPQRLPERFQSGQSRIGGDGRAQQWRVVNRPLNRIFGVNHQMWPWRLPGWGKRPLSGGQRHRPEVIHDLNLAFHHPGGGAGSRESHHQFSAFDGCCIERSPDLEPAGGATDEMQGAAHQIDPARFPPGCIRQGESGAPLQAQQCMAVEPDCGPAIALHPNHIPGAERLVDGHPPPAGAAPPLELHRALQRDHPGQLPSAFVSGRRPDKQKDQASAHTGPQQRGWSTCRSYPVVETALHWKYFLVLPPNCRTSAGGKNVTIHTPGW